MAPLWSAQQATDFNDLLNNVRDILKANKRFCGVIDKQRWMIVMNAFTYSPCLFVETHQDCCKPPDNQGAWGCTDAMGRISIYFYIYIYQLMFTFKVDDMEVPYANFSRGFIPNLNQRQDIVDNPAIHKLLQVSESI